MYLNILPYLGETNSTILTKEKQTVYLPKSGRGKGHPLSLLLFEIVLDVLAGQLDTRKK